MFQKACSELLHIVMPIVVVWRMPDGTIGHMVGAGMMINGDGWVLTAGHVLNRVNELDQQVAKQKKLRKPRAKLPTDYAVLFGQTGGKIKEASVNPLADLGLCRLVGYKIMPDCIFPKFRKGPVNAGEFLCRAGFPFVEDLGPQWDEPGGFTFTNLFPVPMFANEAFVSRFVDATAVPGDLDVAWLETSSPGLAGQSGGPLVDANTVVCGIQVNTFHYPLNFTGNARNQFLHSGRATRVDTVRQFLASCGVSFLEEGEDDA